MDRRRGCAGVCLQGIVSIGVDKAGDLRDIGAMGLGQRVLAQMWRKLRAGHNQIDPSHASRQGRMRLKHLVCGQRALAFGLAHQRDDVPALMLKRLASVTPNRARGPGHKDPFHAGPMRH